MKCVASDKQVVRRSLRFGCGMAHALNVVKKPHLRDPIVGGANPLIALVLVGEEGLVLVCPSEFKSPGVRRGHAALPVESVARGAGWRSFTPKPRPTVRDPLPEHASSNRQTG